MWDAILEALLDTLKTVPVLLVVYFLIELLEHKSEIRFEQKVAGSKKYGPVLGAALGCIPQCGFAAVMADLFSRKMITIGTLFAVFIATSDEAFAILISEPDKIGSVLALLGFKFVLAVIFGYAIDWLFGRQKLKPDNIDHSPHSEHEKKSSVDLSASTSATITKKITETDKTSCGADECHSEKSGESESCETENGSNENAHVETNETCRKAYESRHSAQGTTEAHSPNCEQKTAEQNAPHSEASGQNETHFSASECHVADEQNEIHSETDEQNLAHSGASECHSETSDESEICETDENHCGYCAHNHLHHHHELEDESKTGKKKVFWHIVLEALKHTASIGLWVLAANVIIAVLLEFAGGEAALKGIMGTNAWYQPIVCALIGLVPNCAGSVVLVELYIEGIISFASCLGGLCTGAGIGLIILFKNRKNLKQNLLILLGLYSIGVLVGFVFNLFLPFSF